MVDLFQTLLALSLVGGGLTAVLLVLKPLLTRWVPPRWQVCLWLVALAALVVPVYQWVPVSLPAPAPPALPSQHVQTLSPGEDVPAETSPQAVSPVPQEGPADTPRPQPQGLAFFGCLWLAGTAIFLTVLLGSYVKFLVKLHRNSTKFSEHPPLEEVRAQLGIRRSIPLGVVPGLPTPMLVGVFRPAVYLPDRPLTDQQLRMVLLHELTHYKRRDLPLKWLALLVNAIHWFNPLVYLLTRSLGQACEAGCDQDVTRALSPQERKDYMLTILTLAQP